LSRLSSWKVSSWHLDVSLDLEASHRKNQSGPQQNHQSITEITFLTHAGFVLWDLVFCEISLAPNQSIHWCDRNDFFLTSAGFFLWDQDVPRNQSGPQHN